MTKTKRLIFGGVIAIVFALAMVIALNGVGLGGNQVQTVYADVPPPWDDNLGEGYTVSFNSNGGTGTMTAVNNISGSYTLPACTFTAPEGKKFSCWIIGAPDGPTVDSGSTTEITQDITLYAHWKNTVPSNSELRMGNTFGSRPSSSSYDDVNGVLTLSSYTNCNITVNSTSGRSDLTIVFDGQHAPHGHLDPQYNYLFIKNTYGDITLTSETPVTVYACIMTYGSLIIKGNVHLVPTGLPNTENWRLLSLNATEDDAEYYGVALLTASQKISVLENASITAIDPYIISVYRQNSSILRAKYYEFDTTGEVEIGTKTQVYGTRWTAAICFLDTTAYNSYSEIIGRMTIKRCGQDGCLKLYKYDDYEYNFVAIKQLGVSDLGFYGDGFLHFNRNISAYTTGGVNAELMTLKPCIVTFDAGEGTGIMEEDYTTVKEDYTLPACTFTAPAGKHFAGWSINGADPVNANTTYEVPDQTETLTVTAVWGDIPANALTGTVAINGTLKYGEVLTASVTETNNTGTLGYQWQRNGENIESATNSTYTLTAEDVGKTIKVVVTSTVETGSIYYQTTANIDKADGGVAPTGINATACTTVDNNDGRITGVTTAMEYSADLVNWTDVAGTTITGLNNGYYYVRVKETATHKSSAPAPVAVNAYAPTTYTVTYKPNNETAGVVRNDIPAGAYSLEDNHFVAPAGKQFKAWNVNGTEKQPGDTITISENTIIVAVWEDVEVEITYTVTYKPNNETAGVVRNDISAGAYNLEDNHFVAPEGKKFKAWNVNGTEKQPGDTITISENTIIIAVWEDIEVETTYTVTYKPNNETAGVVRNDIPAGVYSLEVNHFAAPEGKKFKAWNVNGTEKQPGDTITISENTTVIAVWEDIPAEEPEYHYEVVDGVNVYDDTLTAGTPKDVSGLFEEAKVQNGRVELTAGTLSLTFDADAVNAIGGNAVTLTASVATENLTIDGAQLVVEVSLSGATFATGKATISVPFNTALPEGKVAKVYYVNGNDKTDMNALFADGRVTFETTHFSTFAVVFEDEQAAPVDPVNPDPVNPDPVDPQPSNPEVNPTPEKKGLSAGAIAGIVIAIVVVLAGAGVGVFFLLKKKGVIGGKKTDEPKKEDQPKDESNE